MTEFTVRPVGYVRSSLKSTADAPAFYTEGAPNAHLEVFPAFREGLHLMEAGQEIIVLTWLHLAQRDVLRVHPRGDLERPLTGVFSTRSPDRPNPIGLHRVRVLAVVDGGLDIGPIEVIDGTPVLDIKPVVDMAADF